MIAIRLEGNHEVVVLLCDVCEQPIEAAKNASYLWRQGEHEGALSEVKVAHNGRCALHLRPIGRDGECNADMSLSVLLIYLTNSLIGDAKAQRQARAWAQLASTL